MIPSEVTVTNEALKGFPTKNGRILVHSSSKIVPMDTIDSWNFGKNPKVLRFFPHPVVDRNQYPPGTPNNHFFEWMFGETTIFYIKIWNHPTETSIYKWLFRVPGRNPSFRHRKNASSGEKNVSFEGVSRSNGGAAWMVMNPMV